MMLRIKHQHVLLGRLILIALLTNFAVVCLGQFGGGRGTEEEPWLIETAEHLDSIRDYLGPEHSDKFYLQEANIDLVDWVADGGWVPIGTTANSFEGHYDGGGYVIENLTINRPERPAGNNQGLFGHTTGATIKHLGLLNVSVNGHTTVGGLVAQMTDGTRVEEVYVGGFVSGFDPNGGNVGGIAGLMQGATTLIANSYSTADLKLYVGLVGLAQQIVGGIVGFHQDGHISNCYAVGQIQHEGTTRLQGAIAGRSNAQDNLSGLYWNTETTGQRFSLGYVGLVEPEENFPGSTTPEMTQQETFEEYDFEDIWSINEELTYPWLRWQELPSQHNIPAPTNFSGYGGDESVRLTWDAPLTEPLGYNIYRNNEQINVDLIDETEYLDTGLENWTFYDYNVTAVYDIGESVFSLTVSSSPILFAGGTGSEETPYLVETAEHLHGVRFAPTAYYRQIADIDLDVEPYNEDEGWEPIGSSNIPFVGTYDGQFFSITNLMIDREENNQGLFGYIDEANLQRIYLKDFDITTDNSRIGGLAGHSLGSNITDCSAVGHVSASGNIGGLVGYSRENTVVSRCYSGGLVTATSITASAGGLVGSQNDSSIIDSYSAAAVYGNQRRVGGLLADNREGDVIRSYAVGWVSVVHEVADIGGLIGFEWNPGDVENSYWDIESTGQPESAGEVEGRTTEQMLMQETFVQWDFAEVWDIEQGTTYPFLRWQNESGGLNRPSPSELTAEANFADQTVSLSWQMDTAPASYNIYRNGTIIGSVEHPDNQWTDTDTELLTEYVYWVSAVFERNGEELETSYSNRVSTILVDPYDGGLGTEEDPYHVRTVDQLYNIRYLLDTHFIQVADIDLDVEPWNEGEGWIPIGTNDIGNRFTGSYDGDGYAILNLFIGRDDHYQALFAYGEEAAFKNIHLDNVDVTGSAYVASLLAYQDQTLIVNCSATGSVTGERGNVGGLVGYERYGDDEMGALIESYAAVDVTGQNNTGGLIGYSWSSSIIECWATGDVSGNFYVGGLVGYSRAPVIKSYATGDVTGENYAGGLAGQSNGLIENSYATGSVQGANNAGGLAGRNFRGTILNSYSIGSVTGPGLTGGLVAADTGEIENSYWDIERSGQEASAGGEGRVTRQLTYPYDFAEAFIDWDFEEIWVEDRFEYFNEGYPILYYQYDVLDTPVITVVSDLETDQVIITWEQIEGANSYKVYASDNPYAQEWEQIAIVTETEFSEPMAVDRNKFYYVVASSEEAP